MVRLVNRQAGVKCTGKPTLSLSQTPPAEPLSSQLSAFLPAFFCLRSSLFALDPNLVFFCFLSLSCARRECRFGDDCRRALLEQKFGMRNPHDMVLHIRSVLLVCHHCLLLLLGGAGDGR